MMSFCRLNFRKKNKKIFLKHAKVFFHPADIINVIKMQHFIYKCCIF